MDNSYHWLVWYGVLEPSSLLRLLQTCLKYQIYIKRTIKDIKTVKAINKVINKTLALIKTYTSHKGYI